ncbi:MAG: hypothetical protein H6732_16595 [Alphaproteobacteria bacterium]|nr:hypothetical protein [Alphaproteobacteria bacterium]
MLFAVFAVLTLVALGAGLIYVRSLPETPGWTHERRRHAERLDHAVREHELVDASLPPLLGADGRSALARGVRGDTLLVFRRVGDRLDCDTVRWSAVAEASVSEDVYVPSPQARGTTSPKVRRVELTVGTRTVGVPSVTVATLDGDVAMGSDAHLAARDLARAWRARLSWGSLEGESSEQPTDPGVGDGVEDRRARALAEARRLLDLRERRDDMARRQRRESPV